MSYRIEVMVELFCDDLLVRSDNWCVTPREKPGYMANELYEEIQEAIQVVAGSTEQTGEDK